jgi:DNA-3-methyladenine glycosylase
VTAVSETETLTVRRVERDRLVGDAVDVAPRLLGLLLVAGECVGRITEVEAYREDDPASHSHRGRTRRNATMFGPPGLLYVYLVYGIHHCANVVVGDEGVGAAVLIRAVDPVAGVESMVARRNGRRPLTAGPGMVCTAFGIDLSHDGHDLCGTGLIGLFDDGVPPPSAPVVGRRVGITKAVDRPWRWRAG